jgi:predicted nucleic acid-binding protein
MIFIDTGAFLGRYLSQDQSHALATTGWRTLAAEGRRCFTSNFVLDELFTLLGRQADYRFAAERARAVYASKALTILRPDQSDELAALAYFEKFADQGVSFTDCVSFRLMARVGLQEAFSFDRHFQYAGYTLWPRAGR